VNLFMQIETACALIVERAFARVFPSALEPSQIGRKLVSLHESSPSDAYVVYVHPNDFARLRPHRAQLETQWRELLAQLGSALGSPTEAAAVSVVLHPDPRVVAGSVSIEAVLDAPPPRPPSYVLEVESGPQFGCRFPVRREVTIGRSEENDVVLTDPQVSRRHARIVLEDGRVTIEDAGSLNGTYVNGERAGRARLAPNDAIVIGDTKLRLTAGA
jgi:hypothetical protein